MIVHLVWGSPRLCWCTFTLILYYYVPSYLTLCWTSCQIWAVDLRSGNMGWVLAYLTMDIFVAIHHRDCSWSLLMGRSIVCFLVLFGLEGPLLYWRGLIEQIVGLSADDGRLGFYHFSWVNCLYYTDGNSYNFGDLLRRPRSSFGMNSVPRLRVFFSVFLGVVFPNFPTSNH